MASPGARNEDPERATAKDLPDIVRRLFAELEDDFQTAFSMQKQLGGRTDTLKQALIDQKDNQLEQVKENLPDLTETDLSMIQQIQDLHLERLWNTFVATGNPTPASPLCEEATLSQMLKQLGLRSPNQSSGDKEEMMAQFAQQLEAEKHKSLQMMESQAQQFEQEKQALRAREEQLRQELRKMQRTEEEIRGMNIPRPRDGSPSPAEAGISGMAMSRARQNSVVMKMQMPQPIRQSPGGSPDPRPLRSSGSGSNPYPSPISPRGRAQTGTLIVPRRPSNVDMTKAPYQLMQSDQPAASPPPQRPEASKDPSTRSYESTEALLLDTPQENRSCWSACSVM